MQYIRSTPRMEAPPNTLDDLVPVLLAAAIRPAVQEAIADVLPEQVRRALAPPYYTKKAFMELTGLSARKVEYMKERREIDFCKVGRLVVFPREAVHAYLDAGLVPARPKTTASP